MEKNTKEALIASILAARVGGVGSHCCGSDHCCATLD